ncbi:ADP-ribosylglycohydrolase family protein [Streptomyces sp. SL13]|uniref:ADP-ribosylglycohydrolase family protein n=1 Tax=Streptantibioticus silvisoli TaxID=2705255 RepID=A0AA90HAG9_9ACTN|nr:ADP-ribosylglycohydrolase family protein [Streptantibioticus silvisoli]MDI5971077.1 ADP-ribosylglycohydrolase family protein [Streptantibioticus silvisoli]
MQWEAVRASAQWAAYGDALGFITELTDAAGVRRRIGRDDVITTVPWKRRIGGRYGRDMSLPAGAYSDDTQLRLATSRAIRGDGEFDAEAFAKIEIVAWQAYSLGAGRGTKAAATGLMRIEAKWSQNIFATKAARYVDIGGNGAAMRIQPHVWAARDLANWEHITRDVVRNAVSTHGHPRGILGAVLHALLLARALDANEIPGPKQWRTVVDWLEEVPDVIAKDEELAYLWLPTWTDAAGIDFRSAAASVANECRMALEAFDSAEPLTPSTYSALVERWGGFDANTRGSGTVTALLAAVLAHAYRGSPEAGLLLAANALGSDTDTIATMAGALLGAVTAGPPPGAVQDAQVIDSEARRMWDISQGREASTFAYPDLLHWSPPRATLDLVGHTSMGPALAGLGPLVPTGAPATGSQATYVWGSLSFGQSVLVRARPDLRPLGENMLPRDVRPPLSRQARDAPREQQALFDAPTYLARSADQVKTGLSRSVPGATNERVLGSPVAPIEEIVQELARGGFTPEQVGRALIQQMQGGRYSVERAAAFAGLLARAYRPSGQ